MTLITCPDCSREVSDRAPACPGCGFPVAEAVVLCTECGISASDRDETCLNCGAPLQEDDAVQAVSGLVAPATATAPATTQRRQPVGAEPVAQFLSTSTSAAAIVEPKPIRVMPTPARVDDAHITRRPMWSGLVKVWLFGLPILTFLPAAYTYLFGENEIDLPFIGTVDLAAEAAALLFAWGFFIWVSFTVSILPTLIAFGRRTTNRGAVAAINLILGLTGIGWIVALVMALSSVKDPPIMVETRSSRRARSARMR